MRKFLCTVILITAAAVTQNAAAVVMDFEDLNTGATYNASDFFYASGVKITVSPLEPADGPPPVSGNVIVSDYGMAGGIGNELQINGVDLNFLFGSSGCPSCGLVIMFGYYGGDISLGINGDVRTAHDIASLPSTIGGASIKAIGGNVGAMLVINGNPINKLTIGGENLYIDTALSCETEAIPEPATITLLGLGALNIFAGRKKRN